jgi:methylglutaconyl-CoA hydratase
MPGKFLIFRDMDFATLTYDVEERIGTVTLARPGQKNALNDVMMAELVQVFTTINRSNGVRVVVLTGAEASFCSGMDLEYLQKYSELGHEENLADARNLVKLLQLIHGLKKPVIAMVNGPALGGGCGLAAACDFVIVGRSKGKLGAPEVKLGFLPAIILFFLVQRMGEARAREFVLRGDILDAVTARDRGLATDVIDDDRLSSCVYEFAKGLACNTSAASISLTKELFSRMHEMSPKHLMDYAANLNALTRKSEDFRKGIDAFLKKEKIQW